MMRNPSGSILWLISVLAFSGSALVACGETDAPDGQSAELGTTGGSDGEGASTTEPSSAVTDPSASTGGRNAGVGGAATGGTSSRRSNRGTGAVGGAASSATGGASTTAATATGGANSTGTPSTEKFSFFVISYAAIIDLSGSDKGFGGDLRYGEGDGLAGADKICTEVAERGMANNGKTWRAFLSTTKENAIDRVGEGPWYDRRGRVFAMTKADLLHTRPLGADSAIINDFPNENGVTNHNPDGTQVDNHDMLTGSGIDGKIYKATATCSDWTSSAADNTKKPRVGHSWPRSGGRGSSSSSTGNVEGMAHWISALDESGCGPGQYQPTAGQYDGPPGTDGTVGSGGGYGGFYCFALTP